MHKFSIFIICLMLSGCHLIDGAGGDKPGGKPPITQGGEPTPTIPDPIPASKKPNWSASLEQVVEKLVQDKPVNQQDLVLIANVKNSADIDINTQTLTSELKQLIGSTKHFATVPDVELATARETLGLTDEDSLNTRSKTIGLARYLTMPYILYTTVEGNGPEHLNLLSQVMQVQTGELIWSEKKVVVVE